MRYPSYMKFSDEALDAYITVLEEEQSRADDGWWSEDLEGALEERAIRAECASDSRVAQALGRDWRKE